MALLVLAVLLAIIAALWVSRSGRRGDRLADHLLAPPHGVGAGLDDLTCAQVAIASSGWPQSFSRWQPGR